MPDSEYYIKYQDDFSGGINVKDAAKSLADNQLQESLNYIITKKGRLEKRRGYQKLVDAEIDSDLISVEGIYDFHTTAGDFVVAHGDTATFRKIYYAGSASYTEITGGSNLTFAARLGLKDYIDYLLLGNGTQFQAWNGVGNKADCVFNSGTGYRTDILPKDMEVADDRIFMLDPDYRNTTFFTEFGGWQTDPETDILLRTNDNISLPRQTGDKLGIILLLQYGKITEAYSGGAHDSLPRVHRSGITSWSDDAGAPYYSRVPRAASAYINLVLDLAKVAARVHTPRAHSIGWTFAGSPLRLKSDTGRVMMTY